MSAKSKKKTWMWVGIGAGAFVVLAGGAYVGAYFVAGNQVPAHASAADVAIGGMSPTNAEELLRSEMEPTLSAPITINADSGTAQIVPAEAGLGYDYAATIEAAGGGFSWHPSHIYRSLAGGDQVDMVLAVDEDQLRESVESEAATLRVEPTDATITLTEGVVETTEAVTGYAVEVDGTAAAVRDAFAAREAEVDAVGTEAEPDVTDAEVQAFRDGALAAAMTGNITLTSESGNIDLTEEEIAGALTITQEGDSFSVGYDGELLTELTADQLDDIDEGGPKNASYRFNDGSVVVVPGESGMAVTEDAVVDAFEQALAGESRTVALEATMEEPEFTTEEAERLKPREVIGEYSTRYPHAAYRNTNIGKAASIVNGTVLLPGETFSLNGTLGRRTAEAGWASGYVIDGGNLVRASGGGVSQAATTLFNAAFFAGFEDVEHKPHSLYFSRYPAGREATVYYGSVDLRFRNNTEYPAIIQGFTSPSSPGSQGSITYRVWSIPTYDRIESSDLVRSGYYSGSERVLSTANCEPQAPIQGFTVNYKRLFYKDGSLVKEEPFRWRYSAGDRITCA
ncbi:MAG: hypothetical protein GX596_06735 [Propionibacterium sp.]|nr:hypothetical protein [Propionibacterium sp.]